MEKEDRYGKGITEDYLMTHLQCEIYNFFNLKGRYPEEDELEDNRFFNQ